MTRRRGQAGRWFLRLLGAGFATLILAGVGIGALAWRMAQEPLELRFLAREIEAAVNAEGGPTRLEIGRAAASWEGFRAGHLSPFEILLSGVRAVDASGHVRADLPDAAISLSLPWLLRGELAPRALELRRPFLRVFRAPDGDLSVDLGSLSEATDAPPAAPTEPRGDMLERLLAELMQPPSEATRTSSLRLLRIQDAQLQVLDQQLDRVWFLEGVDLELRRREEGGLDAAGEAMLRLGGQSVPVALQAEAAGAPPRIAVGLVLPAVQPAALARAVPALAPLSAIDAPVRLEATAVLRGSGLPETVEARLSADAGAIDLGRGRRIPMLGLDMMAVAGPQSFVLRHAALRLAPPPPGPDGRSPTPPPTLTAEGRATLTGGRWRAEATLGLDAVPFADLAHYWPETLGGNERHWLTENITAGTVRDGRWRVEAEAPEDLGSVEVTSLSGTAEAVDATVHWLRPIPPVVNVAARAEFSLQEVALRIAGGREAGTGVEVQDGTIRFTGLDHGPGDADIQLRLSGPLSDTMALLRHPRLHLFDKARFNLPELSGTVREAQLSLAFPLVGELDVEDLQIRATGRLADVRAKEVVLGRDLERAALELNVTNDGLRISGQGQFAEIPTRLSLEADFRPGPASQVQFRATATARPEARDLARLDFDVGDVAEGPLTLEARYETRRNGQSRVNLRADLRETRLALSPLGWSKPPGVAAGAEAVLRLRGEEVQAIETLRLDAPDAALRARAPAMRQNVPERIEILSSHLGGSRFTGEARPPPRPGEGWTIALRGPVLDLRGALAARQEAALAAPPAQDNPRKPLSLEARFDQVILGEGRQVAGLVARARLDGLGVLREANATGRVGRSAASFEFALAPAAGGRRQLRVTSDDGGALLAAAGLLDTVVGGRLSVDATYDHARPGATLSGTAELNDFSVRGALALGKLLQAMTLYGLFDAVQGEGLHFARLVAPFALTPEVLVLEDARAFSASLGLTAKGQINRRREWVEMEGTIVPAYIFNSLLGRIPLLGKLFSPEAGGGLFAATYRVQGPLSDPQVTVNPLAALTPGFLRGLFGGLEQDAAPATPQR